jgi:GrpB-like predicted nucleotidyltransferase (UPF0157 family)
MVSGLLGDNMTFIDHVGSTAVPGMLAKPIIDIAVRVKDLDAVRGKVNEFLGSGFAYHADFIGKGDEYFTLDHDAKRVLNLHIFADDNPYPLELVAMRDYLIENKVRRDQYCHEKRRIFELYGSHASQLAQGDMDYHLQKYVDLEPSKHRGRA